MSVTTTNTTSASITFNTDKKVKDLAMKKALRQGLTLSAVLNHSLRSFVAANAKEEEDPLARDIAIARAQKSIPEAEARRLMGI